MRRKVILFVSTLVVVVAAMAAYLAVYGRRIGHSDAPEHPPVVVEQPDGPLPTVLNTGVGTGRALKVPIYRSPTRDHNGRVIRGPEQIGRLEADESQVTAPGQFRLLRPRIWNYMADGRAIFLKADTAEITVAEAAALDNINPRHATLSGHVELWFDRGTDPDRPPPQQRPAEVIRIYMDRVEFDYAANAVQTAGEFRLESHEADVYARGLFLCWDEANRRIVDLRLNTHADAPGLPPAVGRLLVRQMTQQGGPLGRPTDSADSADSAAATGAAADPPKSARLIDPKDVQTYLATFNQDVEIVQGYDPADPTAFDAKIFSDRTVSAIFDFSAPKADREKSDAPAARTSSPAPAGRPRPAASSAPAPAQTQPDQSADQVLITWKGLLTLAPETSGSQEQRMLTGLRREVFAEGDNVVLMLKDGATATCLKLHYNVETELAHLTGSRAQRVTLIQPTGRRFEGDELIFDQRSRLIKVPSPGLMVERDPEAVAAGAAGPISPDDPDARSIRWGRQAVVHLAPPADGPAGRVGRSLSFGSIVFKQAIFEGGVDIRQGRQMQIRDADRVVAGFFEPAADRKPNQIEFVLAEGRRDGENYVRQVTLVGRQPGKTGQPDVVREISTNLLTVQMQLGGDGNSAPRRAIAAGKVSASELTRRIVGERMELTFRPAADAAGNTRYEPDEVQVYKNIVITDSSRDFSATGDHLFSVIGSDKATLSGQLAKVRMGPDRQVNGPMIEIDQASGAVTVLGAGSLGFVSDRDLSGRAAQAPLPLRAAWGLLMRYDSAGDTVEMRGDIRATYGTSYVQADLLRMSLEDAPAPATAADTPAEPVAPAATATPAAPDAPADNQADPPPASQGDDDLVLAAAARKRLKRVVAEKNVIVLTSELDPAGRLLTRARIAGDQVIYDSAMAQMQVSGAGTLLMEDYRKPDPAKAGGDSNGLRPSQTAIAWIEVMTFNMNTLLADFQGRVRMGYHGPNALVIGQDGSIAAKRNGDRTSLYCDRLQVQFVRKADASATATGDVAGAADSVQDVHAVQARGNVYVKDEAPSRGETRSMTANILHYDKQTNRVQLHPSADQPVVVDRLAPDGTRYDVLRSDEPLVWDRNTGKIQPARIRVDGNP